MPQVFCPGRTDETAESWEWESDVGAAGAPDRSQNITVWHRIEPGD